LLGIPGLRIDWNITKLDISREGDFAYTLYAYQMGMPGSDGKPVMDQGKDMAVWKKQSNGQWKIEADTFNSDLPAVGKTK
jgi:ketosteroid isomerase-like protein